MQTLDFYILMDKTVKLRKFTGFISSNRQNWMFAGYLTVHVLQIHGLFSLENIFLYGINLYLKFTLYMCSVFKFHIKFQPVLYN